MLLFKKKVITLGLTVLFTLCGAVGAFASFQLGDDGEEVLAIQKRLAELHYTVGTLDGEFGSATEKAV